MNFEFWQEGAAFILIFLVIIGLPCVAIGVLGPKLINHIGQHPLRSSRMQMKVCLQLLGIELFSFFLLWAFFDAFVD